MLWVANRFIVIVGASPAHIIGSVRNSFIFISSTFINRELWYSRWSVLYPVSFDSPARPVSETGGK